jgi:hypothetical protein
MTAQEVAAFVVSRWLCDHDPQAIMCQLICLGVPLKKREILAIVRRYCDCQTENMDYFRRR